MRYCVRCLYPENHPYGMQFNSDGLCMGCVIHEEKDKINWKLRLEKLKSVINEYKSRYGNKSFDCIIPVNGGSDSYYIVHFAKNVLGMNPLLTYYNSHYNTEVGIRNLANLQTVFDCDLVTSTLSPELLKKITKHTFTKYGTMYWQVLAGNTTFPVQIAVKYKIPLIIWGVHGWSEQNGMFSHLDEAEMTERCRKEHCLRGISAEEIIDNKKNVTRSDVQPFVYPYDNEIEKIGVRGIYLSNYLRWDSKKQHELMIKTYGFETAIQQRTFNTYEDVHCFHSAGLHDYMKLLRLGYSKVTDHASREIRLKRLTREDGISLVNKYQYIVPKDIDLFCNWIDIPKKKLLLKLEKIRNPMLWKKNKKGNWRLKYSVKNYKNDFIDKAKLCDKSKCDFKLTENSNYDGHNKKYLLMGRGYLDKYNYGALEDRPNNTKLTKRKWRKPSIK